MGILVRTDAVPDPVSRPARKQSRWASDRLSALLTGDGRLATGRPYAERSEHLPGLHDRIATLLISSLVRPARRSLRDPAKSLRAIVTEAHRHEARLRAATDADLRQAAGSMRARLRNGGFATVPVGECFALISEAASRTIGHRHYPSQLMAGWALLQGRLVEMETGEGKTFAAALPAATVALAGYPVHVITVNDYLAVRDAENMGPLYRFLGLDVASVVQSMARPERRHAYRKPIVYCTNKDLAFDYLRDGLGIEGRNSRLHRAIESLRNTPNAVDPVLRGLYYGIVDEADSIFVDEARTPLILSSATGRNHEKAQCAQALAIAGVLIEGDHFRTDRSARSITLEAAGRDRIAVLCQDLRGIWTSVRAREELVVRALAALILFLRDQHYVVAGGTVRIVDEWTGRVMADRSWERGLHQLIEVKEGCEPTEGRDTLARLTYQRLFRRYIRLAGMTGTAREVAPEIRSVYGIDVVRVPLHRPSRRRMAPPHICLNQADKWRVVAETVERLAVGAGRPVLIGTRSVDASEQISAILTAHGLGHALLNARQDDREAEIIAAAGQPGRITVATNMAGRGTDIRLGSGVVGGGGLFVILTEFHDSRRIDRQLFGRCARQGDPGGCQAIVSLDDSLFATYAPRTTRLVRYLLARGVRPPGFVFAALKCLAQGAAERRAARVRVENLRADRFLDQMLAFSGRAE